MATEPSEWALSKARTVKPDCGENHPKPCPTCRRKQEEIAHALDAARLEGALAMQVAVVLAVNGDTRFVDLYRLNRPFVAADFKKIDPAAVLATRERK